MLRTSSLILSICFSILFLSTPLWAATYYVDPNGNDIDGNGSLSNPWASLSHACTQVMQAGDKIHLNPGTYSDNSQCTLEIGVDIEGAGSSSVTINSTANPYLLMTSGASQDDTVAGNNDISGITFDGNGSNTVLHTKGRNNQTIFNCVFTDTGTNGVKIYGQDISHTGTCGGVAGEGTWCDDGIAYNTPPDTWGSDIEFYNNTMTGTRVHIKGLGTGTLIHDNTWNNLANNRSGLGNTGLFFQNVKVYNNDFNIGAASWDNIAIEMWELNNDCEFYNNTTDSWFSIGVNTASLGGGYTYSWSIHDNEFVHSTSGQEAIEVMTEVHDVAIYNNYFEGAWSYGMAIWGGQPGSATTMRNIYVYGNVFYNLPSYGVWINPAMDNTDIDDIYVFNNTFDSTAYPVQVFNGTSGSDIDGVVIKNNIFRNGTTNGGVRIDACSGGCTGYVIQNNLFDNAGNDSISWFGGTPGLTSNNNFYYAPAWTVCNDADCVASNGTNNDDPDLNLSGNRPDPYYRPIDSTADIVDAGTDAGLPYKGAAPDIGAYEHTAQQGDPPEPPTGLQVLP